MGENSKIEWTDHTFNPWIGCTKVSPACEHCYAEAFDKRFGGERWGPKAARRRTSTANWRKPLQWDKAAKAQGVRRKVFCASLADIFDNHPSILPEWRVDLWNLIEATPNLDWLLLTKRPQNIHRYIPSGWNDGWPNVWLGTTVENQTEAERRIPHLLGVPARVRFLSCEPMLGPIDLRGVWTHCPTHDFESGFCLGPCPDRQRVNWVICGGESGLNARPMHPDWARALRDQCSTANVPFFFKQWGEWAPSIDNKRIQFERVGKARAGRLIDGVEHNGRPE